ncbi:integrase, catalytic region, zinc finger, CCHC-type containing protein, partial [Tanacetum coccineum]
KNINTTQAQQKALDDALVALTDRLEFGKCNMKLKTDIKPKEATFQVVLDALALNSFYGTFLITADVPAIYIDLRNTRDITYLTDVNVDYSHQPWRAFATIINKCLSCKETGMDKIRLSRVKILWDAKKTKKMSYPRFTKIIINYFMSRDQSISRRNKMFWHTTQDDTMFTSMRCFFRYEDTQVYGIILPREITNQAMLESKAYQAYYAFASVEKAPKPKYIRKKSDSDTPPKKKHVQATKGTRLKSKAKVAKPDKKKQPVKKIKAKGLAVLSKVALTKAEQIKLATKRSKKDFHVSHASSSGDGVNTQSNVPDEQQQKTSGDSEDEDDNDDDGDNDEDGKNDDHDDDSDDERIESDSDEIHDLNLTNVSV